MSQEPGSFEGDELKADTPIVPPSDLPVERDLPVEVELDVASVLNFALQQNDVPFVHRCEVRLCESEGIERLAFLDVELVIEGGFAPPQRARIEGLMAGVAHEVADLEPRPDPERLFQQTETEATRLRLTLSAPGFSDLVLHRDLDVLVPHHWPGESAPLETLAAFVLPNGPRVVDLVARSRETLAAATGRGAMSGYQVEDRDRVLDVLRALCATLGQERLGYLGLAPGFEESGQKVRLPEMIFQHGQANCLDLSLLLAGAVELMGYDGLVVLTEGHAFLGVWLRPSPILGALTGELATILNYVELGDLVLIESTGLATEDPLDFTELVKKGRAHLDDAEDFRLAVDVRGARRHGYRPIPRRREDMRIDRPVVLNPAEVLDLPDAPAPRVSALEGQGDRGPRGRIEVWKSKLLDLSLRNRFLNFRSSRRNAPLMVAELGALAAALVEGRAFRLGGRPELDASGQRDLDARAERTGEDLLADYLREELDERRLCIDLPPAALRDGLVHLDREARNELEETGAGCLFVVLGFLEWYEDEAASTPRRAPILLVPVEIERRRRGDVVTLRVRDEDPRLNVTLIEKLERDFALEARRLEELPLRDEEGRLNVGLLLAEMRRLCLAQDRWLVKEEAALALLSFVKVTMWEDLERHSDVLLENPVVSHLVHRSGAAFDAEGLPQPGESDQAVAVRDFPVPLDADSSQLAAILAAARGRSFVLQGPPGTGKSQTIANLIAQAIGEGRRVLFVAEKRAALEVVQRRLEKLGLGPFALEVHSRKIAKRAVLQQLEEAVEVQGRRTPADWEREADRLQAMREELDAQARALHAPRASGRSIHEATLELIALREAPVVPLPNELADRLDEAHWREIDEAVDALSTAAAVVAPVANHPLRGVHLERHDRAADEAIASDGAKLLEAAEPFADQARRFDEELDVGGSRARGSRDLERSGPRTRAVLDRVADLLERLATAPAIPDALLEGRWDGTFEADFTGLVARLGERNERRDALAAEWDRAFFDLEPAIESAALAADEGRWFLPRWFARRSRARRFASFHRQGRRLDVDELARALESLAVLREDEDALRFSAADVRERLAEAWTGGEADPERLWDIFRFARSWTEDVEGLAEEWSEDVLHRLRGLAGSARRDHFGSGLDRAGQAYRQHRVAFEDVVARARHSLALDPTTAFGSPEVANHETLVLRSREIAGASRSLRDWCYWRQRRRAVEAVGLGPVLQGLESGQFVESEFVDASRRSLLETWWARAVASEPVLATHHAAERSRLIERFRDLDHRLLTMGRDLIAARAAARVPDLERESSAGSEVGILRRELRKKRGHRSMRRLFAEIPELLPRLKPCLLMSPLSVAQFLDARQARVDLVVFDEASQIPVPDAIGAIARGAASIIVGDSRQLPPTTFFSRSDDTEGEEREVDEVESILDECDVAGLPTARLLWHYRSRHESLIHFSNRRYYEGRLRTFPAADDEVEGLGVSMRFVAEGVYDRGGKATNRGEAEAIVAEVLKRCRNPRGGFHSPSLGVVAFSAAQQTLIEDLLDEARSAEPGLDAAFAPDGLESVFVKNLENVQGDERDTILFSICYGRDAGGRMAMNFGPLNKVGGERRLNVAITRARRELIVFSSVRAEDLDLRRTGAAGVRDLERFLAYAERGVAALAISKAQAEASAPDALARAIAKGLEARGHRTALSVGASDCRIDVGIVDPEDSGRFRLGILTDGRQYGAALTARDRLRTTWGVLGGLGWNLLRLWSADWWRDPEAELDRIEAHLARQDRESEEAAAETGSNPSAPEAPMIRGPEPEPEVSAARDEDSLPQSSGTENEPVPEEAAGRDDPLDETEPVEPKPPTLVSKAEADAVAESDAALFVGRLRPYLTPSGSPELGSSKNIYAAENRSAVADRLKEIVTEEEPVHQARALRRLAVSWGLSTLTKKLRELGTSLVTDELANEVTVDGEFYWLASSTPKEVTSYRRHEDDDPNEREADEIHPAEAAAALLEVLEDSVSSPTDDLLKEAGRRLGFARLGKRVEATMTAGLDVLLSARMAYAESGRVRLPRPGE